MHSPLQTLAAFRTARTKRISSYDRSGGNDDNVKIGAGETITIAKISGPGCIRHIWCTISHAEAMWKRNVILRMYWDGSKTPSVECPIGDFFGQGWAENYSYAALPLAAGPSRGRGYNCFFPMPFGREAVIEIENDTDLECRNFYYYVDYEELDEDPVDQGRFHAFWNRSCLAPVEEVENENRLFFDHAPNLTDRFNHLILDASGKGHYVGVNYYVDSPTPYWYGEGDDMFFIDGEPWPPSLHGTGTEDYFCSAWCPREVYVHPYFGYPRVNDGTGHLGRTHCYRFHIEDPIVFQKSLRGSIERGHADCLSSDIVTVAYWYQSLPHKPFPPLPPRAGRQNMPPIRAIEIQRWRETWRQAMGGGALWGHEPLPDAVLKKMDKKRTKGMKSLVPSANRKIAEEEIKKQAAMLNPRKRRK